MGEMRRPRRSTAWAIVSLFAVSFAVAGASFWLSVRTVQGQIDSRASIVQLCRAGNAASAKEITLWTYLVKLSTPPPHETPAARAAREKLTRDFLRYVRQVFAPDNCSVLPG